MARDIDRVIEQLKARLPGVEVDQLAAAEPGAGSAAGDGGEKEDGLWFFRMPGSDEEIAVESPTGRCPFAIEHDDMKSSDEAETANTVDEAVEKIVAYLSAKAV